MATEIWFVNVNNVVGILDNSNQYFRKSIYHAFSKTNHVKKRTSSAKNHKVKFVRNGCKTKLYGIHFPNVRKYSANKNVLNF